ncbi:asparagine synthetase B family protein [Streptomyces sp. NPDC059740]|uniref:asparagine synthetase B family protein n=1 Tax=Streptomyces sp. NPDC059740 TaxID=3346926 RepID=UPI0036490F54
MCGIVAVSLAPQTGPGAGSDARLLARRAVQRLLHRGPDGFGVSGTERSAVAMARLRVRSRPADEVPFHGVGAQPAHAYNGEVYTVGGRDGQGPFRVPSGGLEEAEAVHGHDHSCLDGMYALARLTADGTVEVTRDPLGIKPLYLRRGPSGVAVASEVPALLEVFGRPAVRPAALAQFLLLGRVVDGGTFFEGIEPVAPGSRLLLKEGRAEVVAGAAPLPSPAEPGAAEPGPGALREAVGRAVERVLVSDRPLGLAVSGGLDSTVLAAELSRRGVGGLRTVSVVPQGNGDGVRDLSALGLPGTAWRDWNHHWVGFGPGDLLDGVADAVAALGEPTALSSVPMYAALARLARESGIVVLLVGEGADELFGGYRSYLALAGLAAARDFYLTPGRREVVGELLGAGALRAAEAALDAALPPATGRGPAEVVRDFEYAHSLEPLLRRADHLLMAQGVEGRVPFLHGGVPALAASLPSGALVTRGQTKVALRRAYAGELPHFRDEVKKPFRAPLDDWLLGAGRDRVLAELRGHRELLVDAGLRAGGVDALVRRVQEGGPGTAGPAFGVLTLGAWLAWLAS